MQYIVIRADHKTISMVSAADLDQARTVAGIREVGVDFGNLGNQLNIVVYQFGLVEPVENHNYFSIGRMLFAGNAVIFRSDTGDTVNIAGEDYKNICGNVQFYNNGWAVEEAISKNKIDRPETTVNDTIVWQWPGKFDIGSILQ